jgi:hypothetical protein
VTPHDWKIREFLRILGFFFFFFSGIHMIAKTQRHTGELAAKQK